MDPLNPDNSLATGTTPDQTSTSVQSEEAAVDQANAAGFGESIESFNTAKAVDASNQPAPGPTVPDTEEKRLQDIGAIPSPVAQSIAVPVVADSEAKRLQDLGVSPLPAGAAGVGGGPAATMSRDDQNAGILAAQRKTDDGPVLNINLPGQRIMTDEDIDAREAKALGVSIEEYRDAKAIITNTRQVRGEVDKPASVDNTPVALGTTLPEAGAVRPASVGGAMGIGLIDGQPGRERVLASRLGVKGWENRVVTLERQADGSSREIPDNELEVSKGGEA